MNLPAHAFVFQRRIRDLSFEIRFENRKDDEFGGGEIPQKLYDSTLHKRRDFFFLILY